MADLLDCYPSVTSSTTTSWPTPTHTTNHHIQTTGPPVMARPRRLAPEQHATAKAHFAELERLGIIRRSAAPWSTPLHMVPKPDGTHHPCGDYRLLNNITPPDKYPLPNLHDLSSRLHGATVFSKFALQKGYYQVPP